MYVLVLAVGVAAWAFGKTQGESNGGYRRPSGEGGPRATPGSGYGPAPGPGPPPGGTGPGAPPDPGPPPSAGPPPGATGPPPHANGYAGANGFNTGPKPSASGWQQRQQSASGAAWEKARQETRRREEEKKAAEEARKAAEEAQKKKEEADRKAREAAEKEKWEKARAREKEAREREAREKVARERLAREKEAREADAREKEAREKEAKEKEAREKERKEKEAKESREKEAKEREAREAREKDTRERTRRTAGTSSTTTSQTSPKKRYERPTAKSFVGTDEDANSFRPYDSAFKRTAKTASQSSVYSESSYAPSQSTARTTPPPSMRGPYSTKDPDKIVIRAVYLFTDLFPKPVAQLVSGVGSVTDGLILKITTEGLFIDDDVRGVGQREWDVKAWGMKLVEVSVCSYTRRQGTFTALYFFFLSSPLLFPVPFFSFPRPHRCHTRCLFR